MGDWELPVLAKAGLAGGLILGLVLGKGMWCIASALSFFWLGNIISAVRSGEIITLLGAYSGDRHVREDEPGWFWFSVGLELVGSIFVLLIFLNPPVD